MEALKKRRTIVQRLDISQLERNLQFEIRLPNLIVKVSAITITTLPDDVITDTVHVGVVTFQSNGVEDVFWKSDVKVGTSVVSDEAFWGVEEASFDGDRPYVNRGKATPVKLNVGGDSGIIHGWFTGTLFPGLFSINIYVEYEEAEEVREVKP